MEVNAKADIKPFNCDELRRSVMKARQIIDSTLCLDLTYIRKHAVIEKRPFATHGVVTTLEGYLISFQTNYGNEEFYSLEIVYSLGPDELYNLKVTLIEAPSNLEKGSLLYFICPQTGCKCRKLYKLPFSNDWASRSAYKGHLYYVTQICSRLQLLSHNLQKIEDWISGTECKTTYKLYQGKKTKRIIKEELLMAKFKGMLSNSEKQVKYLENNRRSASIDNLGESQKNKTDNNQRDEETVAINKIKWDWDFNETETTLKS